jgi:putative membrane protein insertion efficiency factor
MKWVFMPQTTMANIMVSFLRGLIWLYRHSLSLFMGQQCRFVPSCSAYANEALQLHGAVKGGRLALRRMCRCHPWGGHGFDPVPPA